MDDLISRRAAIEQSIVLRDISNPDKEWEVVTVGTIKHLKPVQPAQKWIPVSERLPEKQDCYLVTTKWKSSYSGDVYVETNIAVFRENPKGWGSIAVGEDVVAWMPLPEPYKAESEDE